MLLEGSRLRSRRAWSRRWSSFVVSPVITRVRRSLERAARRRLQANPALWSVLQDYLAESGSTGCQYMDYDVLYRRVRATSPREVLECGTGVSTVVLAQALRENADEHGIVGRVTSMEDAEPWFEMASELLPAELAPYCDLRLSPKVEDGYAIYRGVRYASIPDRRYELAFIDGPSTFCPSDGTRGFDFDLLHIVRRSDRHVSAIVDGRLTTVFVLQQIFGHSKVRYNPYHNLTYVGPVSCVDMGTLGRPSLQALRKDRRLLAATRFHLEMARERGSGA